MTASIVALSFISESTSSLLVPAEATISAEAADVRRLGVLRAEYTYQIIEMMSPFRRVLVRSYARPNAVWAAFLSFLSWRFSFSDLSGVFFALGFFGDLSGIEASSFPHR